MKNLHFHGVFGVISCHFCLCFWVRILAQEAQHSKEDGRRSTSIDPSGSGQTSLVSSGQLDRSKE